jgi:hypothetical protein
VVRARREGDDELLGRLAGEFGFDGDVDGLVAAVAAERGEAGAPRTADAHAR